MNGFVKNAALERGWWKNSNVRAAALVILCVNGASAFGQSTTTAATSDSNSGALAEIIVTAQRKEQNLQDIPITVSAVSGELALARGITELTDLPVLAPGLNVTSVVGNTTIYLRGVGNNNATAGQEQNVAIYIDGIYYPSMATDPGSFTNLERIEVLKGPQGTLFGRNTTGGLIQFVTRDPTQEFSGNASVGYGNYGTTDASMYVSGGIISNVAADLSLAYHDQSDGWGHNLYTNSDANRLRSWDAHSKWVITPVDGTKITFKVGYDNVWTDQGVYEQVLSPNDPLLAGFPLSQYGNIYNTYQNNDTFYDVGQTTTSLRLDQDLGAMKLMSISAYAATNRHSSLDLDVTPVPALAAFFPGLTTSFSQEFQLSSNTDHGLSWVGGVMFFYMNGRETPLAILAGPTELPVASYNTGQKTNSVAGYGQLTVPITSTTDFTVGGRYTHDKQELYGVLTAFTGTGFANEGVDPSTNVTTFGDFTYKASLDHHFTDQVMGYVSVSSGFKSGVYNITFATPEEAPVKPEKLTDYEIGLKSEFLDHRVRVNLDGFYYDYKDLQLQTYVVTTIITLNAAAAKVYGLEAQFDSNITDQLKFGGGISELHSEYTSFPNVPSYDVSSGLGVPILGLSGDGNQLMRTPDLTLNANLDYHVPVSFGQLGTNITFFHTSGFYFEPDNRLSQSAYNLVNGQLYWKSVGERFDVRLWTKNLFNQQYYVQKISGSGSPDAGAPGAPRTFGLSLGVKF